MSAIADVVDWGLDRSLVGYTRLGHRLRGLDGSDPDPHGRLAGARVVLTGASSGIGLAAAHSYARHGAELHLVVRDLERGEEAVAAIRERTSGGSLTLHRCDVSDLADVAALGDDLGAALDRIDVLVHNAGAMFAERGSSAQGHERTFALHVLGPFLLTHRLAPSLDGGPEKPGRVIFVTSGGAYTARLARDPQLEDRDFDGARFYAHAKRAQIELTAELDRRLGDGITVHAMHPGWARTPGVTQSLPRFGAVMGPLLRDPAEGADTIVWLSAAERPLAEPGGLWMDRERRPEHRVPWTRAEPGAAGRLYEICAELTDEASGWLPRTTTAG
jgi:dehydrogenase/reductase SDR family member 12